MATRERIAIRRQYALEKIAEQSRLLSETLGVAPPASPSVIEKRDADLSHAVELEHFGNFLERINAAAGEISFSAQQDIEAQRAEIARLRESEETLARELGIATVKAESLTTDLEKVTSERNDLARELARSRETPPAAAPQSGDPAPQSADAQSEQHQDAQIEPGQEGSEQKTEAATPAKKTRNRS